LERFGRFVGVGIDSSETLPEIEHAGAEVTAVAEHLRPAFAGDPLVDPDRAEVDLYLRAVRGSAAAAPLLLLWCGHGVRCPGAGADGAESPTSRATLKTRGFNISEGR
jgi:hypothetical protein